MSNIVESDEESDLEQQSEKKQVYINQTRELSTKPKKHKLEDEDEDSDDGSDDSDEMDPLKLKNVEDKVVEEEEEDDFQRQLRLEREEELRKSKEVKKIKVDPDGTEYEWDENIKGWFPKVPDQKFIEYQTNYGTTTTNATNSMLSKPLPNTYYLYNGAFYTFDVDKNNWVIADKAVYEYVDYMTGYKYKWSEESNSWQCLNGPVAAKVEVKVTDKDKNKDKTVKKKEGWIDVNEEKNTNVYVSGLPLDITDDEFEEIMSKYGIIMKDPLTHKLKIKLYRENDEIKGDGRCCYLMPESVKLCLQLLDGSVYKDHKIKVEKAKFEMKGNFDSTKAANQVALKKKLNKSKEKKLLDKQRQRLLDWSDRPENVRQKHEKVVVIKNIFSPADLKNDSSLINKLRDDLKNELETYGPVKKVIIHPLNEEGVATISFKDVDDADTCCEYLDNRVWKNGRIISCQTWDGETKYEVEETEEERQKRIDEWHKFLESDD